MYYRESFEYSPIKMFFNSNSADTIVTRGDVSFNLQCYINLPNNVIGYASLNELTIPNTDYNINTYSDTTNKYTLTTSANTTNSLVILATSTMNSVLGFEPGLVNSSVAGITMSRSSLTSPNTKFGTITVITGTNDTLRITAPNGNALNITLTAGTSLNGTVFATALNAKFATADAGQNCGIVASYNTVTGYFNFDCTTSGNVFTFLSTSNSLLLLGLNAGVNTSSTAYVGFCTLTSTKIADLSGSNSFYITTNLGLANYSFLNPNSKGGSNVLGKIQLTTSQTGIEFYNNLTSFKTRFYDTDITQIHIVLYDEDFNLWVPLSDWSCVIEMTFYEKYDLTTKQKMNNLLFSN